MSAALLSELDAIVGGEHVLTARELRAGYEVDWTRRWRGDSIAVVRPADEGQVAAVVGACAEHETAIVTQGGNTGLVGGATPPAAPPPAIVLSTRRRPDRCSRLG